MNIDNKLDELKRIQQVDAPPFLFTRIQQQIQNLENTEAPVKWKWAFAASTIIILALNISILFKGANNNELTSNTEKESGIENVVSSMKLSSSNNLYNE